MAPNKLVITFLLVFLLLPGCKKYANYHRRAAFLKKVFFAGPIADGPVSIFVHGTKTSLISKIVHQIDYPSGIIPRSLLQTNSVMTRIADALSIADADEFSHEAFYFYSWPGKMTFNGRLKAAERLYDILHTHKGPLTIITHSHGCNVALNLAYIAQKKNDTSFVVDRLILLAPPVQEVTKSFVHSPIFKQVYTFYSTADVFQVGDAQGLYWESYAYTKPCTHIPLFSKRTFESAPNIIQTRILLDWQSPGHLIFLLQRFIKVLPALLRLVTKVAENDGYARTRNHYIVNIPLFNLPPHLVEPEELKNHYVPRSTYYKTKRKLQELAFKSHKTCSIQENKEVGNCMKESGLDRCQKVQ